MTKLTDAERIERAVKELEQQRKDFSPADIAYDLGLLTKEVTGQLRFYDGVVMKKPAKYGHPSIWGLIE